MSVAKKLRVYAHNNCPNCDGKICVAWLSVFLIFCIQYTNTHLFLFIIMLFAAVSYIVSGRVDDSSDWVVISQGDLPWREGALPGRNDRGKLIDRSTYESADDRRVHTEVLFEDNAAAYLHYKLQFPESRNGGDIVQFSEVELPGYLLN